MVAIMDKYRCITNNPLVASRADLHPEYTDIDVLQLFMQIERDIRNGYRLLSHPLSSSIRPDISPYKTVLLSTSPSDRIDELSVSLIREAIRYTASLYLLRDKPLSNGWDKNTKADFAEVDLSMIDQALDVAGMAAEKERN